LISDGISAHPMSPLAIFRQYSTIRHLSQRGVRIVGNVTSR
jgi:hypothetical protein